MDGIGWGPGDADRNPFARAELPHLAVLLGRRPVAWRDGSAADAGGGALALDASMGVAGTPQSGTGQGALITGRNVARLVGGHSGPFPTAAVQSILASDSLWRDAVRRGQAAALATAYPARIIDRVAGGGGRLSSIARAAVQAGIPLRGPADAAAGAAVPPFLGPSARAMHGRPVVADPFAAGRALAAVAAANVVTVYEHFATDVAGHRRDMGAAVDALERLDALIGGILSRWPERDVLVLMSDHGNLEDLSTHHHTDAPAIGAWRGPAVGAPPAAVHDVAPAIREALGWSAPVLQPAP